MKVAFFLYRHCFGPGRTANRQANCRAAPNQYNTSRIPFAALLPARRARQIISLFRFAFF
jgi:hypothetical protein